MFSSFYRLSSHHYRDQQIESFTKYEVLGLRTEYIVTVVVVSGLCCCIPYLELTHHLQTCDKVFNLQIAINSISSLNTRSLRATHTCWLGKIRILNAHGLRRRFFIFAYGGHKSSLCK